MQHANAALFSGVCRIEECEMERLLGGSNDIILYAPLDSQDITHLWRRGLMLKTHIRRSIFASRRTELMWLFYYHHYYYFCLLDDRLIGGSGLPPADFIWVSLMVTLLASMATNLAAAAHVWLLYMHPLCCIIHLLCWLCLMLSFDSVEQCVCERETQRTMTASQEKKKNPLPMHHGGALSRGATTTNKIHQHAIDAVVGLLALRL